MSSCPNSTALVLSQPGNLSGGVVPDFTMINFTGSTVTANFGKFKGNLAAKRGKVDKRGAGGNKAHPLSRRLRYKAGGRSATPG